MIVSYTDNTLEFARDVVKAQRKVLETASTARLDVSAPAPNSLVPAQSASRLQETAPEQHAQVPTTGFTPIDSQQPDSPGLPKSRRRFDYRTAQQCVLDSDAATDEEMIEG